MAVIVKYIVVRNGVEKMTFTTKKEADAYDKMLDIADNLYDFIETADIDLEEKQIEDIAFFLARNKEKMLSILKGVKPKAPPLAKNAAEEKNGTRSNPTNPSPAAKPKSGNKK
jgi:dsDNA-binding SOS-regulon protein